MERAKGQVTAAIRAAVASDAPVARPAACLGVDGLPPRVARLSPGMIYSLACDQQAVRLPLAARALLASLSTGKPCVLVTAGDPAMFLRKVRLAGIDLDAQVRAGALTLFQLAADADKLMFRAGPPALLRELEISVTQAGSFVVLDEADALFMLSDPRSSVEAAAAYLQWVADREHTLLALFAPSAMAPREYLALRRVAENFAGFAVARSSYAGGTLDVRHWFGLEGASPRETFVLGLHDGVLRGAGPSAHDELPPVHSVICVTGAVPCAAYGWRDWQEAASTEEALQAAGRSEAATVVLPFRQPADFPLVSSAVAAVRAMARAELHVVVRECGRRLRAVQALTLMRQGLSSVIPADVSDLGTKRMVDLLKGTRFGRACDPEFEPLANAGGHVLAGATDSPALFCEAVEGWLAAADGFDFESCLVRIARRDGAGLLAHARKSARDALWVAAGEELWLFLFGCPQAAVPGVMRRLLPHGEPAWSAHVRPERILVELEALRGA